MARRLGTATVGWMWCLTGVPSPRYPGLDLPLVLYVTLTARLTQVVHQLPHPASNTQRASNTSVGMWSARLLRAGATVSWPQAAARACRSLRPQPLLRSVGTSASHVEAIQTRVTELRARDAELATSIEKLTAGVFTRTHTRTHTHTPCPPFQSPVIFHHGHRLGIPADTRSPPPSRCPVP